MEKEEQEGEHRGKNRPETVEGRKRVRDAHTRAWGCKGGMLSVDRAGAATRETVQYACEGRKEGRGRKERREEEGSKEGRGRSRKEERKKERKGNQGRPRKEPDSGLK
jgi:hypothetical protein